MTNEELKYTNMRSIRIIILNILWMLLAIPSYAYDFEVDGLCYNKLSNNQVEITYKENYGGSYSGTLIIPSKVTCNGVTYNVTSIGNSAFYKCTGLTGSLSIPNSITSIGKDAFRECSGFNGSLTIGSSVTSIGEYAFYECTKITGSLSIPSSVTSIGKSAFEYCSGFTGPLTIPNSVITIGDGAFSDCSGFTGSLTIPNSVTTIGGRAFRNCSGFTGSLTIPNSVKSIGYSAFYDCSGLTGSLAIPNSVKSIDGYTFYGCSGLTGSLIIPSSVTSIGDWAFYGCRGLTSLVLPSSVASINGHAFAYCKRLSYVESQMETPFSFGDDIFIGIASNAILVIPKGESYPYGIVKWFAEVRWASASYILSISSSGNGYASYNETSIRNKTMDFSLTEGTSPTIIFTPDNGYRIKSVKVNGTIVSVTNNQYTISNISRNTSVEVEFEAIPITTYTLSIKATGNGSASYDGNTIRSKTSTFTVNEGSNATMTFTPDNGYRIKSVKENKTDVTSYVSNGKYTINSISRNTTIEVEFEAIPASTYSLSISASGNGSVSYNGTAIRNRTTSFTVDEGSSATITFAPDNGNSITSVKLNNSDITSQISGNSYTVNNITANTTLSVTFQEDVNALTVDGLNYTVTSQSNKTVTLTSSGSGQVLTVPATITQNGTTWKVTGIDQNALKGNTELAAIIWNPEAAYTATVSNPNLLLYVKSSDYAPATIQNVVVNGTASNIVLAEAKSGNNFYCPQSFVAQKISYTHNYQMQTGIGEARGWETIALPFDVQTITHATKGTIKPFANWKSDDTAKPFWLMELTGTGFVETGSIKAYTPYIISMPNNSQYDNQWLLNGKVTFAANSVTIGKTENLNQPTFNGRSFIPCFAEKESASGLYALNVNNDFETNNSGMTEGSWFVVNKRNVHPFEAYMTSTSSAPQFAFGVFEGMTTGIQMMVDGNWTKEEVVYDLQGRKVNAPSKKGVYIINGKKLMIK